MRHAKLPRYCRRPKPQKHHARKRLGFAKSLQGSFPTSFVGTAAVPFSGAHRTVPTAAWLLNNTSPPIIGAIEQQPLKLRPFWVGQGILFPTFSRELPWHEICLLEAYSHAPVALTKGLLMLQWSAIASGFWLGVELSGNAGRFLAPHSQAIPVQFGNTVKS